MGSLALNKPKKERGARIVCGSEKKRRTGEGGNAPKPDRSIYSKEREDRR